jgi:hypothetical protein
MNCDRRVQAQGKPCMYYISYASRDGVKMAGFCQLPGMFRCIEAVKSFAPRLSHSGINQWMRCRLS